MTVNGADPVKCPACGAENRPTRLFCTNCGAYLRPEDEPAPGAQADDLEQRGVIQPPDSSSITARKPVDPRSELKGPLPPASDQDWPASLPVGGYTMKAPRGTMRRSRVWSRIYAVLLFLLLVGAAVLVGYLVYNTFFKKGSGINVEKPAAYASTTTAPVSTTRTTGSKDSTTTSTSGGSTTTRTTGQVLGTPVIPKSLSASSTLVGDGSNTYVVENLIDNNLTTAWSEGAGNPGVGEWVRFEFGKTVRVDKIEIANGYQKDSRRFKGNPRARTVRIDYSDGTSELVNLYDATGYQYITTAGRATTSIKVTIESVYAGDEWEDTSFSEVRFFGSPG
jgi:hypothetical protein